MKRNKIIYILLAISFAIMPQCFSQHVSFQALGDFPGGESNSSAQAISADGSVIISYRITASGAQAFRWTESTGMVSLGNLPDTSFKRSWANSVSAGGK